MSVQGITEAVTATDRVRAYLRTLADDKRLHQTRIAKALGVQPPAVNRYLNAETPLTVAFLEAVEHDTGIPLGELVAPPGTVYQLDADEAQLIRWLRRWPKSVMHALCGFLAHFADEPPTEQRTRNLHEYWRRMPERDREWLYGVAVMLREGTLPPDLQSGLMQRLTTEVQTRRSDARRRRETS